VAHGSGAPVPTADDPLADVKHTEDSASFPVIIRATNGKSGEDRKAGQRVKLSTIVQPGDLDVFYARYAEICKAGMLALKPRVRTKRKAKSKKKKATA
jgi:signal recognition particle subunit SRP14